MTIFFFLVVFVCFGTRKLFVVIGLVDSESTPSEGGGITMGLPAPKYRPGAQQAAGCAGVSAMNSAMSSSNRLSRILQQLQPLPKGGKCGSSEGKMRMRRSGLTTVMEQPFPFPSDAFSLSPLGSGPGHQVASNVQNSVQMPTPVPSFGNALLPYGTFFFFNTSRNRGPVVEAFRIFFLLFLTSIWGLVSLKIYSCRSLEKEKSSNFVYRFYSCDIGPDDMTWRRYSKKKKSMLCSLKNVVIVLILREFCWCFLLNHA